MKTKTGTIARAVMTMTDRGFLMFNDRLVDGRRSLKVWGWTPADYEAARNLLTQAGCSVTQVEFDSYSRGMRQRQIRLHVQE